ncbi:hypothetical protein TBLA_0B05680 [Henningerozyma blattae CBS 6284]|uniref:RRM Nup35-type domain-containing protein n=1 Tax=Henningerozyma blattae (strain ATCC 34711 / CBS 6284 / DSM 70876 / NBRC 10599 / NRRL Y-10934 / UCD 77-7) TaxID=1071380 RepID=I2GZ43_HENB6|nr:hypothetical protein TBLA_0B05680 [Tetrapisispora blattae CBS 6284]CCH59395.1 hypothetical protein TBLA_0B05680 [Tetrapisispora blattae CBS 6284]
MFSATGSAPSASQTAFGASQSNSRFNNVSVNLHQRPQTSGNGISNNNSMNLGINNPMMVGGSTFGSSNNNNSLSTSTGLFGNQQQQFAQSHPQQLQLSASSGTTVGATTSLPLTGSLMTGLTTPANMSTIGPIGGSNPAFGNNNINEIQQIQNQKVMWYNNPKKRSIPEVIVRRSALRQQQQDQQNQLQNQQLNMDGVSETNDITMGSTTSSEISRSSGKLLRSDFNNVSFGSSKNNNENLFKSNDLHKQSPNKKPFAFDNNEAPPSVSLHDWEREDEFGSIGTTSFPTTANKQFNSNMANRPNTSLGNFTFPFSTKNDSTNPMTTLNINSTLGSSIFDKNDSIEIKNSLGENDNNNSNNNESQHLRTKIAGINNSKSLPFSSKDSNSVLSTSSTPAINSNKYGAMNPQSETAVIIFGYPESVSNSIISYFAKFGNILEDFQVLRGPSGLNSNSTTLRLRNNIKTNNMQNDVEVTKKYPIFTGDGWVKLTYDLPSAAIRALQENGTVLSGSLIGCIPYSKAAVEQLASCKIDKIDDIGTPNFSIKNSSTSTNSIINNGVSDPFVNKGNFIVPSTQTIDSNSNHKSDINNDKDISNNISLNNSNLSSFPTHKLDIKDGKSLFIHNRNNEHRGFLQALENKMRSQPNSNSRLYNQHQFNTNSALANNVNSINNGAADVQNNDGMLNKVNNWLFGWNDL